MVAREISPPVEVPEIDLERGGKKDERNTPA